MKVECFDPAYWLMWLTIFSLQWMQEMLLRCPVSRISIIDYVSVALTTAIWKPRYIPLCFPFLFWDIPRTSLVRIKNKFYNTNFGIRIFVHAVEWLLHISSTINHQSRICVAGRLGSANMTEIYRYVLQETKVCWKKF